MSCQNSTVVSAPIDKVWEAINDFHDMWWCPNVINQVDKIGPTPGTEPGAKRVLNQAFHETLIEVNHQTKTIRYSIDDGPGPVAKDKVAGYIGIIQLIPVTDDNSTLVMWTSEWEKGSDEIADFCNPIYQALLADLKNAVALLPVG